MLPAYCEESEDDHTRAHHVGVRVLQREMYAVILGISEDCSLNVTAIRLTSRAKCSTIQMTPNDVTSRS